MAFNCYRHWAQIILRQPEEPSVTILIREGVTQRDPLLMVLYSITLVPLAEDLRAADPGLLSLFYVEDAVFSRSAQRSAHLLKLLMKRGPDRGYFTDTVSPSSYWTHRGKRRRIKGSFLWRD